MSNLRVEVEERPGGGETGVALRGEGVVADHITVAGDPLISTAIGVRLETRAMLRNSSVQMPNNFAIQTEDDTLIEDVSAAGAEMLRALVAGPPVIVRRLRSSAPSGAGIYSNAAVNVSDSLIRLSGSGAGGLRAFSAPGQGAENVANHVTVIGTVGSPTPASAHAPLPTEHPPAWRYATRSSTASRPTSRSSRLRQAPLAFPSATRTSIR